MSRVFVVQNQHRWDQRNERFVPKFDLSSAEEYGELVPLLSPTASPFNAGPVIVDMQEKLKGFSNDDYLLLIGNPALIGWAVAIAADYNEGAVTLLQWSGKDRRYIPITADNIFPDLPDLPEQAE